MDIADMSKWSTVIVRGDDSCSWCSWWFENTDKDGYAKNIKIKCVAKTGSADTVTISPTIIYCPLCGKRLR